MNRIVAKERKSKVFERTINLKQNIFIEIYSANDGEHDN